MAASPAAPQVGAGDGSGCGDRRTFGQRALRSARDMPLRSATTCPSCTRPVTEEAEPRPAVASGGVGRPGEGRCFGVRSGGPGERFDPGCVRSRPPRPPARPPGCRTPAPVVGDAAGSGTDSTPALGRAGAGEEAGRAVHSPPPDAAGSTGGPPPTIAAVITMSTATDTAPTAANPRCATIHGVARCRFARRTCPPPLPAPPVAPSPASPGLASSGPASPGPTPEVVSVSVGWPCVGLDACAGGDVGVDARAVVRARAGNGVRVSGWRRERRWPVSTRRRPCRGARRRFWHLTSALPCPPAGPEMVSQRADCHRSLRRPAKLPGDHGGRSRRGGAREHLDRVGRWPGLGMAHGPAASLTVALGRQQPLRVGGRRTAQHRLRRRSPVPTTALVLGRRRAYKDRGRAGRWEGPPCAELVHSQERSS
jgi:hypothetical protein